jgi:transcriptional regulator with XRE-family HTH domain
MNIQKQVGHNIRRIRLKKGIAQETLALATGIDRAYMSGIERGVRNPTLEVLARIAQGLNVAVGDLTAKPSSSTEAKPKNLTRGRNAKARTKR